MLRNNAFMIVRLKQDIHYHHYELTSESSNLPSSKSSCRPLSCSAHPSTNLPGRPLIPRHPATASQPSPRPSDRLHRASTPPSPHFLGPADPAPMAPGYYSYSHRWNCGIGARRTFAGPSRRMPAARYSDPGSTRNRRTLAAARCRRPSLRQSGSGADGARRSAGGTHQSGSAAQPRSPWCPWRRGVVWSEWSRSPWVPPPDVVSPPWSTVRGWREAATPHVCKWQWHGSLARFIFPFVGRATNIVVW